MSCHSLSKVLKVQLRRENTTNSSSIELTGEDASTKEVTYKHSDGVITVDISGTEHGYYKEGTDAYKEVLQKYNKLKN